MIFQIPFIGVCSIILFVLVLLIMYYTLKNLKSVLHKYLLYLEIIVACLLICYTIYLMEINYSYFAHPFGIFMLLTLSVGALLFFILHYFYEDKVKGSKWIHLIFIIPVIAIFGDLTDFWLHLIYVPVITSVGVTYERGIVAIICNIYCFVVLFALFFIILLNVNRANTNRKKKSVYILLVAALINIILFVVLILGIYPISMAPLGCGVTVISLFFAIYFTDFFDKYPLGWETFISNSTNAFIFIDLDFNIVNFNSRFLDFIDSKELMDMNIFDLNLFDDFKNFIMSDGETKYFYPSLNRWFKITNTSVFEEGIFIGRLLVFMDITEDTIKTQNLEFLNSVVADVERSTLLSINYKDKEGKFHWSDEAYHILEREPRLNDVNIDIFKEVIIETDFGEVRDVINYLKDDDFKVGNYTIKTENGKIKYINGTLRKISDSEGNFLRLSMSAQDVTDNVKNIMALRHSDYEKTVLLKEIHHRVKNNLQLMSSFINLEEKFHSDDPERIINTTKDRINSLALIHERIYNEENMDYISVCNFLKDFDNNLFVFSNQDIKFIRDISEDLNLHIDIVTPLTLMINELTINTFKYAFKGDFKEKIIYKSLNLIEKDGKTFVRFEYKDNGVGLPKDYNIRTSKSLGWTIILSLSSQLDGEYELINENGLGFILTFPI